MKGIFRDREGELVGPGNYTVVGTRVAVTAVSRPDGLHIDGQDAAVVYTVEPFKDEAAPEVAATESTESRVEVLERALLDIWVAFDGCFTPDFKGVDWDGDAAIQALAAKVYPILNRAKES